MSATYPTQYLCLLIFFNVKRNKAHIPNTKLTYLLTKERTAMTSEAIAEHSQIVLLIDQPGHKLEAGAVGAVVHIHPNSVAYVVEFPNEALVTLEPEQVRPLDLHEVLHVRL